MVPVLYLLNSRRLAASLLLALAAAGGCRDARPGAARPSTRATELRDAYGHVVRVTAPASPYRRETEEVLRAIATLDAAFERNAEPTADERARYDAERAHLKARLAAALAGEHGTG